MAQILTNTFDCNGKEAAVSTVREDGESLEGFHARHMARVDQAKADCKTA